VRERFAAVRGSRGDREALAAHPIRAQNKALAIMEHEIFFAQAYRRTGGV